MSRALRERFVRAQGRGRWWVMAAALAAVVMASPLGCGDGGGEPGVPATVRTSLADGWFKENCAMGFEVQGAVYTEWADAPRRVVDFRGEIVNAPDLTAERGALVLRITEGNAAHPAGRYTVVRWSDFTGATIQKRVAARGAEDATRATAEAALAELTVEDGWFDEFCCPFAIRYGTPRLAGTWSGDGLGFTLVPIAAESGTVFQLTVREGAAVVIQGTVDRASYAAVAEKGKALLVFTAEAGPFDFRTFTR